VSVKILIVYLLLRRDISKKQIQDEINVKKENYDDNLITKKPFYYTLKCIISHIGETEQSGHYITDVRDIQRNKWVNCNDDELLEITTDTALGDRRQKGCYIFFYQLIRT